MFAADPSKSLVALSGSTAAVPGEFNFEAMGDLAARTGAAESARKHIGRRLWNHTAQATCSPVRLTSSLESMRDLTKQQSTETSD